MYELVQAGERTYYINSPAKIGLYLEGERDVYLIDSGNDKDAGRKVKSCWSKMAGSCARSSTPIRTPTTSAGTASCRSATTARSSAPGWRTPSPATRCSSRPSSTEGIPARS